MIRWSIAQFFELLWWKHYLKKKESVLYLKQKREYWRQYLSDISIELTGTSRKRILDAGGGPAGIFIELSGHDVTMCDPLLAKYQNSLAVFNPKQYSYVQFVESPIETFFSPRPFQYVFCLNVVNHVKELDRTIDRLYELTEPGGCLILSTDCHNFRLLRRIFQLLQFDILHPHQFTADEYLKIFQNGRKLELVNRAVHKRQMIFSYTSFVFKKADPEKTGDAT